ncbi:hypothetical protein MRBBS_1736 [Marinobacter sp. BSs20148]|nr:hypothetical protein MRBBS_1736 [Marinobacter sp. BSs20148]
MQSANPDFLANGRCQNQLNAKTCLNGLFYRFRAAQLHGHFGEMAVVAKKVAKNRPVPDSATSSVMPARVSEPISLSLAQG